MCHSRIFDLLHCILVDVHVKHLHSRLKAFDGHVSTFNNNITDCIMKVLFFAVSKENCFYLSSIFLPRLGERKQTLVFNPNNFLVAVSFFYPSCQYPTIVKLLTKIASFEEFVFLLISYILFSQALLKCHMLYTLLP